MRLRAYLQCEKSQQAEQTRPRSRPGGPAVGAGYQEPAAAAAFPLEF
jgi:hypothetical protein